ncbi:MAG: HAD-IIIA family hydrolase [Planctomycetes bacterium]|nr:HAD-IIIA family hydrolase [Planctomycetota bacterium]MBL7146347.1 HAD-IIIA family hydrolase [Phycisphaerae bacterium]
MSYKAIFLDRDDTLIEDPGYISSPEQVNLLTGVPRALIELKALGYKLVVVTNQSAVARGIVTEKVLGEIHKRLEQLLAEKNAFLDGIYYCPYHPEGAVKKYRQESELRKPNPGMLLKAAEEMDLDLDQSWCVGNSSSDIEAGLRAGCKTILIDLPSRQRQLKPNDPRPDHKAINIKEVVNIVKKYHRSSIEAEAETKTEPEEQVEPVEQETEQVYEAAEPVEQVAEQIPEAVEPVSQATELTPEVVEPFFSDEEQKLEQTPEETQAEPTKQLEQEIAGEGTEQLLKSINTQLKNMQRTDMFGEFSIMRLIAGIIQIIVLFCLLISIWFLISPNRQDNSVFTALGFAMVLQLMSLTFYIMHGRK